MSVLSMEETPAPHRASKFVAALSKFKFVSPIVTTVLSNLRANLTRQGTDSSAHDAQNLPIGIS